MEVTDFNKEPETKIAIRFQDCDPFGHLNNARYIDYFVNAREDHLADYYDLDIYERQRRTKTNWVVAKTKIAYIFPVIFRETVTIKTRLIRFTENSLLMEGVMSGKKGDLKSVIWIEFRYFDLAKGKPGRHPDNLMELFDRITIKGINTDSFDSRVRDIRNEN